MSLVLESTLVIVYINFFYAGFLSKHVKYNICDIFLITRMHLVIIIYLKHGKFMINKNSQTSHRNDKKLDTKSVVVTVVCCPKLLIHKKYCGIR